MRIKIGKCHILCTEECPVLSKKASYFLLKHLNLLPKKRKKKWDKWDKEQEKLNEMVKEKCSKDL